MAQKSSIELEVKFDDIDQNEINKIASQLSKAFSNIRVDPNLTNVQKELNSLQKDQLKTVSQYEKLQSKALSLSKKRGEALGRIENIQARLDNLSAKSNITEEKISRKIIKNQEEINRKKQEAAAFRANMISDDEESTRKLSKLQNEISEKEKNSQILIAEAEQAKNKFQADTLSLQKKINDNIEHSRNLEDEIKSTREEQVSNQKRQEEINNSVISKKREAFEEENRHFMGANMLMQDRFDLQQKIAEQMRKTDPSISHAEALDFAKKEYPLSVKQSKLDAKAEKVFLKTHKLKKREWKFKKQDLKLFKERLKREKVGMFARRRALKEEEAALLKQLGLRKGMFGIRAAKGKPGVADKAAAAAGTQVKGLVGAIGKLAGPLMALGSIAGFIMLMLEYDKRIKDAQKSLFVLASNSDMAWKKISEGQQMGLSEIETYRSTLRGLWGTVGMTYEDALKHVGDLTNAGIKLGDVMKNNAMVMQEVEKMALLSGKSFGDMSAITGEWVTEFRKGTGEIMSTFVTLRDAAAKTDFTTNRFFSSVMNAAHGLAIYGTKVEDVAGAFADLVSGIQMPQKEAAKLANEMIGATDTMTVGQKVMVAQLGGAEAMLKARQAQLQTLKDTGEANDKQVDDLNKITKLLERVKEFPNDMEKQTALFEALDPGLQIETRLRALINANKDIFGADAENILGDPDKFANVLSLNRKALAETGKQFQFTEKQLRLIEQNATKRAKEGKEFKGIGKDIIAEQSKAEEKAITKKAKQQAKAITDGTKSFKDMVAQYIGGLIEQIYFFLTDRLGPFMKAVLDLLGKDAKHKHTSEKLMAKQVADLKARRSEIDKLGKSQGGLTGQQKRRKQELTRRIEGLEWMQAESEGVKPSMFRSAVSAVTFGAIETPSSIQTKANYKEVGGNKIRDLQDKIDKAHTDQQINDVTKRVADRQIQRLWKNSEFVGGRNDKRLQEALNVIKANIQLAKKHNSNVDGDKLWNMINSAVGFSVGGYTGAIPVLSNVMSNLKNYRTGGLVDAAGIVHTKEFVFDKNATRNIGVDTLRNLQAAAQRQPLDAISTRVSDAAGNQSTVNNNQSIVININQRDRQEIEQIVRKVMYSERAS